MTERSEDVPRLNARLNQLRCALDQHAIVSVADKSGTITAVNQKFCDISGYSENELIGRDHRILNSGYHTSEFFRDMWRVIGAGNTWHGEICNRRKDGQLYWVESTISPVLGDDGVVIEYVSIRTDITHIKNIKLNALETNARQINQHAELVTLIKDAELFEVTQERAFKKILETVVRTLKVDRVAIWILGDEAAQFSCMESVSGNISEDCENKDLNKEACLAFFEMLNNEWMVMKHHLNSNPAAMAFVRKHFSHYLDNALIAAPIAMGGKLVGFLVQGDSSPHRTWHYDEEVFLAGIADIVALSLESIHRRHIETELKINEERLRRSQSFANIGTWDWNIKTGDLFWSEQIPVLFGHPAGSLETTYDNFLAALHPDDKQLVVDAVNACIQDGVEYNIEHRCMWPTGEVRWMSERGDVIRDEMGEPQRMLGVVRDITHRKRVENELRNSEAQLMNAHRLSHLTSWVWDISSGRVVWSDTAREILKCDPDECVPTVKSIINLLNPADLDKVSDAIHQVKAGKNLDVIHRLQLQDGQEIIVHSRGEVSFGGDGLPITVVGTMQDITANKRLESHLKRQEGIFESMFRNAPDALVIANTDRETIMVNEAFTRLFGYEQSEVLGRTTEFLYANNEGYRDTGKSTFNTSSGATTRYSQPYEINYRKKNGSVFTGETVGTLLQDSENQALGYIGHIRDITERKQAELQLLLAKETAEKANNAKSQFLSSMSHELRTPMNAILGFAQYLDMDDSGNLQSHHKESVGEILTAGHHLLELINQVLDLAKIESGHVELEIEAIDLRDIYQECYMLVSPLASYKDVTVSLMNIKSEHATPIQVNADRVRFKQVLLNLISNAIKYNVAGGSVEISHVIMSDNVLRIEIRDSGIGISESDQINLFRPFSRFGDLQHKVEGTGIGLVISKQLIDMMGGKIGFKSKVNEGSEFWIEIPYHTIGKLRDEDKVNSAEAEKWTPEHHDITLLYVEDNAANIRLVSRLVTLVGQAKLISAPTAILGLELATVHKPDLILMDLQMPGLDGFQALKQLQENPGTCRIPVVAVSANVMDGTIQKCKQAGFADYIAKPINIHNFFEVIEKAVQANSK